VPICGQISPYNSRERRACATSASSSTSASGCKGFRIGNHLACRDQALGELMTWYRAGCLKWRGTVAEGFEQAPAALVNMLSGGDIGKQVVQLGVAAE
jgi:NADPH-dependent curcumin reductase CurA